MVIRHQTQPLVLQPLVRPGRAFLRGLIDASSSVDSLEHRVHLTSEARAEVAWWHTFLQVWSGVSVLPPEAPSYYISSDASGSWGCGVIFNNLWIQLPWPVEWAQVSIAPKELTPIVFAVALWGPQWAGNKVCCQCDNAAVVCAINKKSARDPTLSRLLRILAMFCAIYDITVVARHLPGVHNTAADALFRDRLTVFLSLNPQASPMPTVVPTQFQELVFNNSLHCTSHNCTQLLTHTLRMALRQPHAPPHRDVTQDSARSSTSKTAFHSRKKY